MAEDKKPALISEAVTWRKAGQEAVILNMETSEYYSVNDAGTFIWEMLSAGEKGEKIAKALAAEYGIPENQAKEDTAVFLKSLSKLDLMRSRAEI